MSLCLIIVYAKFKFSISTFYPYHYLTFLISSLIMPKTRSTGASAPQSKGKSSAQAKKATSAPKPTLKQPAPKPASSVQKSNKKNQDGQTTPSSSKPSSGLSAAEAKLLKELQAKLTTQNRAALQAKQDECMFPLQP